jgi:protein SCO1/2
MRRRIAAAALLLLAAVWAAPSAQSRREYPVTGLVLKVDRAGLAFTASIDEIPGLMRAMVMPFDVLEPAVLDGLAPGAAVAFTLVVAAPGTHAERIHIVRYRSVEQDPLAADRLKLLNEIASGRAAPEPLAPGDSVPDFRFIDQARRTVRLSELRGKIVAINFIYTSCALPNFCLRIANNFGVVARRFPAALGKELVLLTVTFDPVHDTPDVLAEYAGRWNADPASWHFLTGSATEVQRVCQLFGVDAFSDEGLMNHSLHTAIIDRQGRLVANIEGNQFTADQLGDLVQTVLGDAAAGPSRPTGQ